MMKNKKLSILLKNIKQLNNNNNNFNKKNNNNNNNFNKKNKIFKKKILFLRIYKIVKIINKYLCRKGIKMSLPL